MFFSRVVAVRIYKIHVFDETFSLLTIRVSMATKLIKVVTCCRELPPKNLHNTSTEWSCEVTWWVKWISPPAEDVWTPNQARHWLGIRSSLTWLVDFNAGKTQLVSFEWSNNTGAFDVKMVGSILEEKSSFKMLGLTFSS